MNEFKFNDLRINQIEKFEVIITDHMMNSFREISGDLNPLHNNKNFAIKNNYRDRVVFGLLVSSFYSKLIGVHLPGKYALLHEISLQFSKPVFIGDKLRISGEVVLINDTFKQIVLKAYITNQKLQKISRAKIKIGILK